MLAQFLVLALFMFLPARDVGWWKGWLFLLVNLAVSAIIVPLIWRVNPGFLVARSRMRWAKRWDMILGSIMLLRGHRPVAWFPLGAHSR
jgi:hypothetical protein